MRNIRLLVLLSLFAGTGARPSSGQSCTGLTGLQLPDVRIAEATAVAAGETEGLSAGHCRVSGVIGREIRFELLLPDDWNGRFAMGGGGGFVGSIQNAAAWTVNQGFATVGTDTGHEGPGISAAWALNEPERQINFGHLAVHRTAEVAKAVIRAHYSSSPDYSYFLGCSRGGGQALMEAQRYPADFDGIVAGAPAYDWSGFAAEMIQNVRRLYPDPSDVSEPLISAEHRAYLERAVLEACDELDGVDDDVMGDPRTCSFDFSSLPACPAEGICFTAEQVAAIQEIYAPPSNDEGPLFVGQPYGGEGHPAGWEAWITGRFENVYQESDGTIPSLQWGFGTQFAKYLVFGDPNWDYTRYDFSTWEEDVAFTDAFMNATNPDLSSFEADGNKLILWHGWSDAALSALASIDYYERVEALDPDVRDYFKMYLMPGVLHCGGGPGPDQVDWLSAITEWVENGRAPGRVIASKTDEDGSVMRTRPLCPYPARAIYTGEGSTDDAERFECRVP